MQAGSCANREATLRCSSKAATPQPAMHSTPHGETQLMRANRLPAEGRQNLKLCKPDMRNEKSLLSLMKTSLFNRLRSRQSTALEHTVFTEQTINLMLTRPAWPLSPLSLFFTGLSWSQPVLLKHDVKQTVELLFEQSEPLLLPLPQPETKRPLST